MLCVCLALGVDLVQHWCNVLLHRFVSRYGCGVYDFADAAVGRRENILFNMSNATLVVTMVFIPYLHWPNTAACGSILRGH